MCDKEGGRHVFKMNLKNNFLIFLMVLFCCDVGESDIKIKARRVPSWRLHKKCIFRSEND